MNEAEKGAKPRSRAGLWLRIAGTLLTLGLLFALLRAQGWPEIGAALQRLSWWRVLLALAVMFVSRTAVALRWHALLHEVDSRISALDSLRISYAGLFAANFLPTTIGGDVIRLAACLQLRIGAALATASLVADRLIGMAGMALFLPWGLVRMGEVGLPRWQSALPLAGIWTNVQQKVRGFLGRLWESFRIWLRHPRTLLIALGFTLIHQLSLYVSIRLILDGLGEPVGWLRVAGIWSLVYFITLLPVSINGYGVQEVSTVLLYAHLGGISTEAAAVLALLQRIIQMAASLPGAFFAPGIIAASRQPRS